MLDEVIWISGADQDYLECNPVLASTEAIDALIELIRLFPEMGAKVRGSDRLRRGLVGRKRRYGLYYTSHGNRLIIVALLDLSRDSATIDSILKSRIP